MFCLVELIQLRASGLLMIPTWALILCGVIGIIPLLGGPLGLYILKTIGLFIGSPGWIAYAFFGGIPVVGTILFAVLKFMGIFTISWAWIILIILGDIGYALTMNES